MKSSINGIVNNENRLFVYKDGLCLGLRAKEEEMNQTNTKDIVPGIPQCTLGKSLQGKSPKKYHKIVILIVFKTPYRLLNAADF